MARAGLMGAAYNVRINLKSIQDEAWGAEILSKLEGLVERGESLAEEVHDFLNQALN